MSDIATAGLVLSSLILVVAALLGWREWSDRRDRALELSPEDARHFARQDSRRSMGIAIMVLLAIGLFVGSRTPHKLDKATNPQFLWIWLGIFLLIFFLLSLAMSDWLALRTFALRHRKQILRERIEILREENRLKKARGGNGNGHGEGPLSDLFS
jgi:hypothetical protein